MVSLVSSLLRTFSAVYRYDPGCHLSAYEVSVQGSINNFSAFINISLEDLCGKETQANTHGALVIAPYFSFRK